MIQLIWRVLKEPIVLLFVIFITFLIIGTGCNKVIPITVDPILLSIDSGRYRVEFERMVTSPLGITYSQKYILGCNDVSFEAYSGTLIVGQDEWFISPPYFIKENDSLMKSRRKLN